MFYDTGHFKFSKRLESNWYIIKQELDQLPPKDFIPYPERYLLDDRRGWDIFGLYFLGVRIDLNCDLCPETAKYLKAIPGMMTAGFSLLAPGAHIVPHSGKSIGVLRCHLGLTVPEQCALRVGADVRPWREGQCLIFDDTYEHEAWNLSDRPRIVLLLDFKAPQGFLPTPQPEKKWQLFN